MISEDLFNKILIEPAADCNQLNILSGYASPAMANKHISKLHEGVSVNLVVGMVPNDGMGRGGHNGFAALNSELERFKCNYVIIQPAVHIKSYIWLRDGQPKIAFTGSGNYSQNAFFGGTAESFAQDDPAACEELFRAVSGKSISCLDPDIETKIRFYEEFYKRTYMARIFEGEHVAEEIPAVIPDSSVVLSLLNSRTGETHEQSGLNWGQRPGREPNQAYIPVPAEIARSDFFPGRTNHFTLITDDGQSLDCAVAQDGNKAIETTKSNSILGRYFRQRLGVPNGGYVALQDLQAYGRTDVTISKIDDETYFMNFSVG